MAVAILALALCCATALAEEAPLDAPEAVALTSFNWDRVPVNIHFGKRTGELTDAQIEFIAKSSRFIVLEKGHGADVHGSTEAGIFETAKRIKLREPSAKILFYLNAFINWPGYESYESYRPEWNLRDSQGKVMMKVRNVSRPDPSNARFREWWSDIVAKQMKQGAVDGVFIDALPQALTPGLARSVGPEKAKEIVAGLREMIALTKHKIGKDKVLLANGTRGKHYREILDWNGIDGVMIEHFAAFNSNKPADIAADLETMALAATRGKFVVIKGWPGFNWLNRDSMKLPYSKLLKQSREAITFPLACFLVGAQPGSHFCYSWGYTDRHGMLDAYPQFDRPLGKPLSEAIQDGWNYKREFAHAAVSVNLETKAAEITWK